MLLFTVGIKIYVNMATTIYNAGSSKNSPNNAGSSKNSQSNYRSQDLERLIAKLQQFAEQYHERYTMSPFVGRWIYGTSDGLRSCPNQDMLLFKKECKEFTDKYSIPEAEAKINRLMNHIMIESMNDVGRNSCDHTLEAIDNLRQMILDT